MVITGYCKDCKWMMATDNEIYGDWNICEMGESEEGKPVHDNTKVMAESDSGEDYYDNIYANMYVKEDFGCVQFEAKEIK